MHYIYKCLCKQTSELNQFAENNQISLLPEAMDNTVNNVVNNVQLLAQTHHFTS